jgi:hypothetical protein
MVSGAEGVTTHHELMAASAIKRQVILEALAPFGEDDANEYNCPLGMTCGGIARQIRMNLPHAYQNLKWLETNGYVRSLGRRRTPNSKCQGAKAFILTEKGRSCLNPVGQGASDLVRGHRGHEYDARAVHPERPTPVHRDK